MKICSLLFVLTWLKIVQFLSYKNLIDKKNIFHFAFMIPDLDGPSMNSF